MGMAQPPEVVRALQSLDSEAVGALMDRRLEITIEDQKGMVNAREAERQLADFFEEKRPSRHTIVHDAQSKGASTQYLIGSYVTSTGNYRSYFFLRERNGAWVIQEIRIEKE